MIKTVLKEIGHAPGLVHDELDWKMAEFLLTKNEEIKDTIAQEACYEYEPDEIDILKDLLPKNLSIQVFRALLENFASEQGARLSAMDNATRNAGEMIDKLKVTYNRSRQATITSELIEIISGAEAV